MIVLELINEMFYLQNKLNIFTCGDNWVKGKTNKERKIDWLKYAYMETFEALESIPYKHWKNLDDSPDYDNIKMEIIDIIHFLISEYIRRYGIEEGAVLFYSAFEERYSEIIKEDISEGFEKIIYYILKIRLENNVDDETYLDNTTSILFKICTLINFSFEDIYKLYVSKNVLNIFRQDNRYKEGEYIKDWNGKEDNEILKEIISKLNNVTFDILYRELDNYYKTNIKQA